MTIDSTVQLQLDRLGVPYEIFPCDPALADTANFSAKRQHGAEDLADRRNIVLRDPFGQAQQCGIEQRLGVEDVENFFCRDRRWMIVQRSHYASQPVSAEGYEHAAANYRLCAIDAISKRSGQRNWQRHVTELRHYASAFAAGFADFARSGRFR